MKKPIPIAMHRISKRHITLIEMMIVMFLIATIIGIVGYNYQGSLEEGKVFKTKTGIEKLTTILMLRVAEDSNAIGNMAERWREYVTESPLVQNPSTLIKDGWGNDYSVDMVTNGDGDPQIRVSSSKLEAYKRKNPHKFPNG